MSAKTKKSGLQGYLLSGVFFFSLILTSWGVKEKTKILMIGDSTMSVKPEKAFPENGWGMALEKMISPSTELQNHARNGRSTKSFISEGLWEKVFQNISPGDYVIIQFGHNDEKNQDSTRYTLPQTTYKENLRRFINDTRSKKGFPILCTPIVRRKFGKDGKLVNTHGEYPQAVRELATEMQVPLVDLEKLTMDAINEAGEEGSKQYYMILAAGEHPNFPEGKEDNTHLKEKGASLVARLFVTTVQKQQWPLAALLQP